MFHCHRDENQIRQRKDILYKYEKEKIYEYVTKRDAFETEKIKAAGGELVRHQKPYPYKYICLMTCSIFIILPAAAHTNNMTDCHFVRVCFLSCSNPNMRIRNEA